VAETIHPINGEAIGQPRQRLFDASDQHGRTTPGTSSLTPMSLAAPEISTHGQRASSPAARGPFADWGVR
jgi:hypothetical protein